MSPSLPNMHGLTMNGDTPSKPSGLEDVTQLLANDDKVKVAGIDCDGILRGKIMSKEKFLSTCKTGFGFSSAVFGWDMHDQLYTTAAKIATQDDGYADFTATADLSSFRRIPWEDNIPFFLLHFSVNDVPVSACSRSMLKSLRKELADAGYTSLAGVELEFMNFQTPGEDGYSSSSHDSYRPNLAAFLEHNAPRQLRPITAGNFGYSLTRPTATKKYFYDIFNKSTQFDCNIEGWHTETGPGVYEAALKVNEVGEIADRVSLFKYLVKSVGIDHGVTPCFMAKPLQGAPGNSGHIHVSLCDSSGKNLFARDVCDETARWHDIANLSDIGRSFLAGLLQALPDLMPVLAPTVNSYKRLVENYWAPVDLTWGLEDRLSSIRLIAPPICKPSATRFEVRVPGADMHPHFTLQAILGAGWRGIKEDLELTHPPAWEQKMKGRKAELLPNTLQDAVKRFNAPGSLAREVFSSDFVAFFTASREHELRIWREAVTDWEFKRYIEPV